MPGDWIQCYSGGRMCPLSPDPAEIHIRDIAHSLSQINRYTGHARWPYSVAQHSILVCLLTPRPHKLHALLHDATEAYLCDVSRPVKQMPEMAAYRAAEKRLQRVIFQKFGLDPEEPKVVQRTDREALWVEANTLLAPLDPGWLETFDSEGIFKYNMRVERWEPEEAEKNWLEAFHLLYGWNRRSPPSSPSSARRATDSVDVYDLPSSD